MSSQNFKVPEKSAGVCGPIYAYIYYFMYIYISMLP